MMMIVRMCVVELGCVIPFRFHFVPSKLKVLRAENKIFFGSRFLFSELYTELYTKIDKIFGVCIWFVIIRKIHRIRNKK